MKKILTILLILSIFLIGLLIGCSTKIIADIDTDTTQTIVTVTVTSIVEDTSRIEELEEQLNQSQEEIEKYQKLIANLNELLKNVYYGYASNSKWILDGFTAFSMEHKGKYYLITAGHCVENSEVGKMTSFKFKANFSDKWIYPKLLDYENDFQYGKDYAIFYTDKIDSGLNTGEYELPMFVLGYGKLNIIKDGTSSSIPGESGSPVININGEVIGIMTGSVTNINNVLEAIDNLK
ncbi:MAG: hypothetical protein M1409_10620 [Actinobacteria bacterium]|nr:hypothetical protein [Actinomycetota bacterium]